MEGVDAEELIQRAEGESKQRLRDAENALDFFIDRQGQMFERAEVAEKVAEEIGISEENAAKAIRQLTDDIVDPVQQIVADGEKRVGIIEYHVWENSGAYGYVQFHDLHGARKRVVCAKCASDKSVDSEVAHATEGEGTSDDSEDWSTLLDKVTAHYAEEHDEAPENIEPGASLVSGTTIAGNSVWHTGNDGSGSGLAADLVDGYDIQKNGSDSTGVINFKT